MNKSRIVSYFILCLLSFSGLLGQLQPKFTLTKGVTGAEQYQIILSMNPDLSDPIWTSDPLPSSSFPYVYQSSNPSLESGSVYYAQIIGLSNGVQHGIPGEIMLFQTPSISLPIIIDGTPFSWRGTDPPAASYEISVSPLQDMTNVVWTKNISETNTSPPNDIFELGKTYYWIVQGLSESGDQHGKPSKTGFFITGVIEPPNLTSPVNEQITNLNPEFSWNGVEDVSRYQILVSESDDFLSSLWFDWKNGS